MNFFHFLFIALKIGHVCARGSAEQMMSTEYSISRKKQTRSWILLTFHFLIANVLDMNCSVSFESVINGPLYCSNVYSILPLLLSTPNCDFMLADALKNW